jgi:maltose/moltooligosaccharide transporter
MIVGGIGLLTLLIDPATYYIPASLALGLAWGSTLAIHFAMITSNLPKEKMGLNIGIFNTANGLAQIVCGIVLGPMIKYLLNNRVTMPLAYSGLFMLVAAVFNLYISDQKE